MVYLYSYMFPIFNCLVVADFCEEDKRNKTRLVRIMFGTTIKLITRYGWINFIEY